MNQMDRLLSLAETLVGQLDRIVPAPTATPQWQQNIAFRWRGMQHPEALQAIHHPVTLTLDDMLCIDRQKSELIRNTRQLLHGLPANNALLWGARGTGKSSLVKALLHAYASDGLRLIEVDRSLLIDLPDIIQQLEGRNEKFILFCDDLSFEANDPGYKALKAALDGSLCALPDTVRIYATSNRRHLMPEFSAENLETRFEEGEIHPGESVEEKISLSERFGIWLSFHPFSQDHYLSVVRHWLQKSGTPLEEWEPIRAESLRWALKRGSRSGRVAEQFARDWSGRQQLENSASRLDRRS